MQKIFETLRQSGLRITPLRKKIFEIYQKKNSPLSIPELQNYLEQKKFSPNTTTLYRQMETLVDKKIFHKVFISPHIIHYEITTHHHHHFTCTKCKTITCIEDVEIEKSITALEKKMMKKKFSITEHTFSLSGICNICTL